MSKTAMEENSCGRETQEAPSSDQKKTAPDPVQSASWQLTGDHTATLIGCCCTSTAQRFESTESQIHRQFGMESHREKIYRPSKLHSNNPEDLKRA